LIHGLVQFFRKSIKHCNTFQFQELGKQRLPDEEEDTFDCLTTELENSLSAESTIGKELINLRKNKSDSYQLDGYSTVKQNVLVQSATMSDNVLVIGSAKENDCDVFTKQNTTPSKVTNFTATTIPTSSTTVIASDHSISNTTAASKQCDYTFIPVITTEQNTTSVSEQIGLTTRHSSILPKSFADGSHITVTARSETCMHSARQCKTEDAKITAHQLKSVSKVRIDSLEDNSDTASGTMTKSEKVTDRSESSPVAHIGEYSGTSDESQNQGHDDLLKVEPDSFISCKYTEMLCISNCDTEVEFYKSMNLALISVLKKRVGESASQILATSAMGFFKKELSCMMQKLMMKALSSVMDNVTGWKKQDQDPEYKVAAGVTGISRMVLEWKEEFMLVTNDQRIEKEKATVGGRTKKRKARMSELYCNNMALTQSNWEAGNSNDCNSRDNIDHIGNNYNDCTEVKNSLVGSVQDFMQLQDVTDCKMRGIPINVSDQGTQTVSTGCILYLECLHDL
jgi:hypothetical protein